MRNRFGILVCTVACLFLLVVLAWPYTVKSTYAINTYYSGGIINPLIAGILALAILGTFVGIREKYVSAELGSGLVFAFGVSALVVTFAWAFTTRVDVFRAPGWALPAQRFVLVGIAALIVVGAGWHLLTTDTISVRSSSTSD